MLIQYYNMLKAPKIKKAFLTAMKMFIFDHTQLRNKKILQEIFFVCFMDLFITTDWQQIAFSKGKNKKYAYCQYFSRACEGYTYKLIYYIMMASIKNKNLM